MAQALHQVLMMKVAITNHDGRVSPVFDVARRLVLADVEQGRETSRKEEVLDQANPAARAHRIAEIGVDVLICGAISRPLQDMLTSFGVQVTPWVCGSVEEVLQAFLCGRLSNASFLMPGCCGRRRRVHGHRRSGGPI